ncbi:MAG: TVP38/TMEM64 family protein [Oscillatoria sp. PMC 1051.18]|nr:TVP38/TMEM64 family protein [Oscillatoria sp. PMC 1050.18]MEC5033107.1 TVP38/TMEM64 family protein [Oscillatoria sp. PMC 1051.18]
MNSKVKLGIGAIVIAGVIIAGKYFGVLDTAQELLIDALEWIRELGIWGIVAFVLIYAIATVFLIPGSLLTLGAGFLYQVILGSIIVSIASTLGATLAFLVGRYLARDKVAKLIESKPNFQAVDEAVAKEGWKIIGLTRLSPVFPFVFLNYAFGVTQVSLKDYVLASWIGMMPGTIMYVYLGSLAQNLATLGTQEQPDTLQWIIRIVGFIATVAVTVYVTKIAREALNQKIENEAEVKQPYASEE